MISTRLTRLLRIEHPIIQAGMGSETRAELVAAVSEAGGLGMLGTGSWPLDWIRDQIRRTRERTSKPFGVNLLLPFACEEKLHLLLDERVPLICTAWGDPRPYVDAAHDAGAMVMHMVQTVDQAADAVHAGVDIVMAQGTDAGGHVHAGGLGTLSIVPQVRDVVADKPLAAAGGIVDSRTAAACLVLGADAVVCGTLFLATPESNISDAYRLALLRAGSHDTELSAVPDIAQNNSWPPGAVIRLLANQLIQQWRGRENELKANRARVAQAMADAAEVGDDSHLVLCSGQGVGTINTIKPAGVVVGELATGIEQQLDRLPRDFVVREKHVNVRPS